MDNPTTIDPQTTPGDAPPKDTRETASWRKVAGNIISIGAVLGAVVLGLWVWNIIERHPRTDDATVQANVVGIAPRVPTGRPRKIDRERLATLVKQYPDATLVELRDRLGVACSPTAIWMALDAMRISFKKKYCAPLSKTDRTSRKNARAGKAGKSASTRSDSSSSTKHGQTRK